MDWSHTAPHIHAHLFQSFWVLIKELGFERRNELDVLSRNVELQSSRFVACIERERGFWKTEEEEEEACTRTSLKLSWIFGVLHWSSIDFLKPGLEVWNKGVSQEEGVNRCFSWQKSEVSEAKKLQWKRVCWPCYPERLFHDVLVLSTQVSATEKKEKKTPPAITHQHNTKIFGLECNFFPAKMQCSSHSFTTYKPLEWIKSQSELNSNTFQFFCFLGVFFLLLLLQGVYSVSIRVQLPHNFTWIMIIAWVGWLVPSCSLIDDSLRLKL